MPQKPNSLQQTFNGHSLSPVDENCPHSALASQLLMHPVPQYTGP
jgi:hypothetical protein